MAPVQRKKGTPKEQFAAYKQQQLRKAKRKADADGEYDHIFVGFALLCFGAMFWWFAANEHF